MVPGFTIVDNDNVLDNEELNIQEQSVLISLISYYNEQKGYAYPSYKQLMRRSKIKKDETLIKVIKSLVGKGYIKKETVKGIGCKYYLFKCNITPTPKMELPHEQGYPIKGGTPTPKKEVHPPHKRGTTNTNTNIKTNTKYYIDLKFIDDVIDRVKITQEQYDKLVKKFNEEIVHKNIINLDNYIANGKGNKYKDHYRALNTWCNKSKSKDEVKPSLDRKNLEDWRL
ncbi:hypothetical protein CF087_18470 [Clostridium botulinum]|nr:hypothetical protein [Clostridium botulinum]MBN3414496.1 hypothetical protein [Clostridium botulinum]